jgi:hypothetical protein
MHEEAAQCLPQQILDDFGLNQILCENEGKDAGQAPMLQSSNQVDQYDLSNVGVQKPPKIAAAQRDKQRDKIHHEMAQRGKTHRFSRSLKLYSGAYKNDILPIQEIDVVSESGMYSHTCFFL